MGILKSEKRGRELAYSRAESEIDLDGWRDALAFFSEADPLGVIGSFLLDKCDNVPEYYGFKHHYILHALESEVLYGLAEAIDQNRRAELELCSARRGKPSTQTVLPIKIFVSTQGGRRYLMAYQYRLGKITLLRLDSIRSVKAGELEPEPEKYRGYATRYRENMWGVSVSPDITLDHIEMNVRFGENEEHILRRLEREKRTGRLEIVDSRTYRIIADVYDAAELLPWIRTFIGRIVELKSRSAYVTDTFYADMRAMR